jgi:hypothetical protein
MSRPPQTAQAAASPRPVLAELDEQLYAQYVTTNHNIQEGKNPFIKFGQKGAFSLTTPKAEESDAESLQHFFPERYYVALLEVLATVNCYSDGQKFEVHLDSLNAFIAIEW